MTITPLSSSDPMWNSVQTYASNCSWRAGSSLAQRMDRNEFTDWERVFVAFDHENICGFCTVSKIDCIQGLPYTPYIGYLFVGEEYRGKRLSENLIHHAMNYLRSVGFHEVYLISDHVNLYEKYGFRVIDRKMAPWGEEEKIYMQRID